MPGVLASRCCPCMTDGKGSRNDVPFGADSHGFCDHCLRFTTTITRGHARLASSCLPGFAGRDWLPAGSQRKVSVRTSSFPKLRLARPPMDSVPPKTIHLKNIGPVGNEASERDCNLLGADLAIRQVQCLRRFLLSLIPPPIGSFQDSLLFGQGTLIFGLQKIS